MKYLSAFLILLLMVVHGRTQSLDEDFSSKAGEFLDEFVMDRSIQYQEIQNNPSQLKQLVSMIGEMDFEDLKRDQQLAFLINAYNMLVINLVVEHYPISSPMDVPGFFDSKEHWVGGKQYTLNQIENELIREPFKDARIHFVLVCAAESCPPIAKYAYTGERLDEQLDERTRMSLNDPDFIRVNKKEEKVLVSEIFKWYEKDFYWDAQSIIGYINQYRDDIIPPNYEVGYYTYDWSLNDAEGKQSYLPKVEEKSNIQEYTPSKLLNKGQFELQMFNNLYTQTAYRDGNREKVDLNARQTYYTGMFYALFGVSENARLNVGFDVNIRSVRIDDDPNSSALRLFKFEGPPVGRTALATIGPKIKISPFKNFSGFSIQSAFWIPLAKNLEGQNSDQPWLDYDMFTWWNQFFYDKLLSSQLQIFSEVDLLFRFEKDFEMQRTHLQTPVSFFLNYFPDPKFTVYVNAQYAPTFMKERLQNNELGSYTLNQDYAQAGLGLKYQLTAGLNLELSYSNFFTSMNGGAGNTYNLGIRYIR